MQLLQRNKTTLYYSNYAGKTMLTDSDGNMTGEYVNAYTSPTKLLANVAPATGEAAIEQFGTSVQYDKIISVADTALDIDENSVIFLNWDTANSLVDTATVDAAVVDDSTIVPYDDDGNPLYDYIVKKVAQSKNYTLYAVSEVDLS